MMSLLHENGWGVGRSKDKAESYKKLAYEGYSKNEADLTPDELMRLSQLAEKEEEAADWESRAAFIYDVMAKRGDAVAGYKLAKIIEEERDEADEVELPDTSESFEKAKKCMEDQGHSGMSWSLVCAMIKEFCVHGEEFVMWLNKK